MVFFFRFIAFYFRLWWVFIAIHGLLTVVASLAAEHDLCACRLSSCGSQALEFGLSSCEKQAQMLPGMWDHPTPGIEPMSLALQGGFLTTGPPGKSYVLFFKCLFYNNYRYTRSYKDSAEFLCGLHSTSLMLIFYFGMI